VRPTSKIVSTKTKQKNVAYKQSQPEKNGKKWFSQSINFRNQGNYKVVLVFVILSTIQTILFVSENRFFFKEKKKKTSIRLLMPIDHMLRP